MVRVEFRRGIAEVLLTPRPVPCATREFESDPDFLSVSREADSREQVAAPRGKRKSGSESNFVAASQRCCWYRGRCHVHRV